MGAALDTYKQARQRLTESIGILPNPSGNSQFTQAGIDRRTGLMVRPSTPNRTDQLNTLLFSKTQEQYARTLSAEAAGLRVGLSGPVTDPRVLAKLRARADFASAKIAQTYQKQLAKNATADVVAQRATYKPDQIWNHELGQARHSALVDFYTQNPIERTAHVEPTDAHGDDECQDAIDRGSVPVSDMSPEMPSHPNCPHGWYSDPVDTPETLSLVSDLVDSGVLWTAGLLIDSGGSDTTDPAATDGGDEELSHIPTEYWENKQTIDREALKFSVPTTQFNAVRDAIRQLLPPDKHDPNYQGQLITSVYFDTPNGALKAQRLKETNYVVIRLRNYESGDYFIEAKTSEVKVRSKITEKQGKSFIKGDGLLEHVGSVFPELKARLNQLVGDAALKPVVTMTYTRYAVVKGGKRITLDRDIQTDTGKKLPYCVLECKFATGTPKPYPQLARFKLKPLRLSKFLFAVGAGSGQLKGNGQ